MKIFISSTAYDLSDFRDLTIDRLKRRGHEVVYHENGTFPVHSGMHSHDECILALKQCDLVICIIDRRYGGRYSGRLSGSFNDIQFNKRVGKHNYLITIPKEALSITWCEVITAFTDKIDVITFARDKTLNEKETRRKNQRIKSFVPAYAEKNELFDFLDWITLQKTNNWIIEYNKIVDFEEKLLSWIIEKEKQKVSPKHSSAGTYHLTSGTTTVSAYINPYTNSPQDGTNKVKRISIILEGESDREIIKFILNQINTNLTFDLFSFGGKSNILRNLDSIVSTYSNQYDYVIVLIDNDTWEPDTLQTKRLDIYNYTVHYIIPEIEYWILAGINTEQYLGYQNGQTTLSKKLNKREVRAMMYEEFDLTRAVGNSKNFKEFIDLIFNISRDE